MSRQKHEAVSFHNIRLALARRGSLCFQLSFWVKFVQFCWVCVERWCIVYVLWFVCSNMACALWCLCCSVKYSMHINFGNVIQILYVLCFVLWKYLKFILYNFEWGAKMKIFAVYLYKPWIWIWNECISKIE